MVNLLIKILEIFTLDYIPRLPIQFRTKLYKAILPLRKTRDRILLNKPKSQSTFQDRIDFARTSRVGYDYSGSRLIEYNQNVHFEKIDNLELYIYKFTPKNAKDDLYGIYFHGGGYYTGSVTSHKNIVSQFTNDLEIPFYFFEYKLTPEFNFPAAHDDAKKAVEIITEIEESKQSIWMGESAGGGLATGILVDETFTIAPEKLVLMSPWLDLSDKKKDRKYLKNKDILLAIDGVHWVGEHYSGDYEPNNPILSPVFADIDNFPNTLIQVCSSELLYNDAIEFSDKLKNKKIQHELQIWDDLWHAWQFFPIQEAYDARKKIISFIKDKSYTSPK